jgi:uncharacterized coiled-coil protein SlyX
MNRFHRSFIGLMERCNTGEWVKQDEAQAKINDLEENNAILDDRCSELREKVVELRGLLADSRDRIDELTTDNALAEKSKKRLQSLLKDGRFFGRLWAYWSVMLSAIS